VRQSEEAGTAAFARVPPEDEAREPWRLAAPSEDRSGPTEPPLPVADRRPLFDLGQWRAGEHEGAKALANAAHALGRLDERLRFSGEGPVGRLALLEASAITWLGRQRITPDRIALYGHLSASGAGDDAPDLRIAAWAARRLGGELPGDPSRHPEQMAAFLGHGSRKGDAADALVADALDWAGVLQEAQDLHPISRAALAWHVWTTLEVAGPTARVEGAVAAARTGVGADRTGGRFLPVALAGAGGYLAGGTPKDRMKTWYGAVERSALRALMELARIDAWHRDAAEATAGLSGRTPARLLDALAALPLASAPVLEHLTGASRAAVQRNLDRLVALGLVSEVTGQDRYRIWRASTATSGDSPGRMTPGGSETDLAQYALNTK
jgi:hypothetical protein